MVLKGTDFILRTVELDDAEFILSLRTDVALAKYISFTPSDIEMQKKWIGEYKKREMLQQEFYFITVDKNGEEVGLSRIYNFEEHKFELGSWIYKRGIEESISILADFLLRDFAYQELGFKICKFEVNKQNKKVLNYHKLFSPMVVSEDEKNIYFELTFEAYCNGRDKILKLLKNG